MKETKQRGILFSKPMMEANLDWRKGETRRVIKGIPEAVDKIESLSNGDHILHGSVFPSFRFKQVIRCPYGMLSDIIYARETIWTHKIDGHIAYEKPSPEFAEEYKCTPAIHMPKIHSRFWAEITEVRAERLLDITDEACINEGIETRYGYWRNYMALCTKLHDVPEYNSHFSPRQSYFSLWDSINGKDSHLLNPWVWVVKYKQIPDPNAEGAAETTPS